MKTRVAILGATGYGGGELLRLLLRRPDIEVVHATSRNRAGTPVAAVHRNLLGLTPLCFSDPAVDELAGAVDLVFGAMPHGDSARTLAPLVERGLRVIDLSGDFRLRSAADYRQWYHTEHAAPGLLSSAVYGLVELNRERIAGARLVACPGCFATSILLALLPAAGAGWLGSRVDVVAMTGSSGSGAEPREGTHHPTRVETLRAYKVLDHQHTPEILQTLGDAGGTPTGLSFTPVSAPLARGILAIVSTDLPAGVTAAEIEQAYRAFAARAPFVKWTDGREPEPGPIAGTNYAELKARRDPAGRLHVMCAIDNLVKGAAGQAVQCLNVMLGLDETTGLDLAGTWP
jgi:N-acetyl-gamma-glutamyl-phosphate reductase